MQNRQKTHDKRWVGAPHRKIIPSRPIHHCNIGNLGQTPGQQQSCISIFPPFFFFSSSSSSGFEDPTYILDEADGEHLINHLGPKKLSQRTGAYLVYGRPNQIPCLRVQYHTMLVGIYPQANQFPQSISLTIKKHSAHWQEIVPPH